MRVRSVELSVRETGLGRLFVWGHGMLSSVAQEDATGVFTWTGLSSSVRVVRYDARGHGRSEASHDEVDYRWPSLGQDMLALLQALGAQRAVLGGASMGCATALHAAVAAPERVEALVLAIPPTAWATREVQAPLYAAGAWVVSTIGMSAFVAMLRALPGRIVLPKHLADRREASLEHLARAEAGIVRTVLLGASHSDLPDEATLAKLGMPTLILAWEGDPSHPVSTAEKLARLLPASKLHRAATEKDIQRWPELVRGFVRSL
jgi:3-oxoadipate enol-lactonase